MTQEAFTPTPLQTIDGTGPYTIAHGYDAGALVVAVLSATARTVLTDLDYSVTPASSSTGGTLTLSAGAAQTHAGLQLQIARSTPAEQGWAGQTSRETGLEAQLDVMVRGLQDLRRDMQTTLRGSSVLNQMPVDLAGRVLIFDQNRQPAAGPLSADIQFAGAWADALAMRQYFVDADDLMAALRDPLRSFAQGTQLIGRGGFGFVRDDSQAAWGMDGEFAGWRPFGDVVSTNMMGTQAQVKGEFKARIEKIAVDCAQNGWQLLVTAPEDGSAFDQYSYIRIVLPNNSYLHIHFDYSAVLKPVERFQVFPSNGVQTQFVLDRDVWDFDGESAENYGAEFVKLVDGVWTRARVRKLDANDNVKISYDEATETWTAYNPDLSAPATDPLPADGFLKIVSARPAFGVTSNIGTRLRTSGWGRADISRGGVAEADAGRSGFSFSQIEDWQFEGVLETFGTEATNYRAAPLDQRGDSGVVPLRVNHIWGGGLVITRDVVDAGLYLSGGGLIDNSADDTKVTTIAVRALRCGLACKDTREMPFADIDIYAEECSNDYVNSSQGTFTAGKHSRVRIRSLGCQRRVVEVNGNDAPLDITVSAIDWGEGVEYITPTTNVIGLFLDDCTNLRLQADFTWRDRTAPEARQVLQLNGSTFVGNDINLSAQDADLVVRNNLSSGAAVRGNRIRVVSKGHTTLYSDAGNAPLQGFEFHDLDTGAVEAVTTWTPNMKFAGQAPPTHSRELGGYQFQGGRLYFTAFMQVTAWAHALSATELRVPLPPGFKAVLGYDHQTGAVAIRSGVTVAGQTTPSMFWEVHGGEAEIRFRWDGDGAAGAAVTSDHIATGNNVILQFTGFIFAEEA